jgi:hypothetical protein
MLKAPDVDVVQICVDESHDSGIMTTVYSSCLFWAWLLEFNGNLEVGAVITSACDSIAHLMLEIVTMFVSWKYGLVYHTANYFKKNSFSPKQIEVR